jgi:hypothetical protein
MEGMTFEALNLSDKNKIKELFYLLAVSKKCQSSLYNHLSVTYRLTCQPLATFVFSPKMRYKPLCFKSLWQ